MFFGHMPAIWMEPWWWMKPGIHVFRAVSPRASSRANFCIASLGYDASDVFVTPLTEMTSEVLKILQVIAFC